MAVIKQTDFARGRKEAPTPYLAGQVACVTFEYAFGTAWTAATDIAAIGYLPAGCVPIAMHVISTALGSGATANIGFMSGDLGSTDTGQTSGAELGSAVAAHSAAVEAPRTPLLAVAKSDRNRPIGLKTNQDVTADPAKRVRVQLWYQVAD